MANMIDAFFQNGSELNMFAEFTMRKSPAFSEYFGFTEAEVDKLYYQYGQIMVNPSITSAIYVSCKI